MNNLPLNHDESSSHRPSSLLFTEPNLFHAKIHQKSTKLGFISEKLTNESPEQIENFCPCCGNSLEKQPFPIFCDNSLLKSEISFSYYIFLKIMKKTVKFLLLPYFFIVTIPTIILMFLNDPTENISSDRKAADLIFLLYFLIFSKVFLPFWLNKELAIYYKTNKSLSFLTFSVSNLPKKWTKEDLKSYFELVCYKLLRKDIEIERIVAFRYCEALRGIRKKIQKSLIKQRKFKNLLFRKNILRQSNNTKAYVDFLEEKYSTYVGKAAFYQRKASRIMHNINEQNDKNRQFAFIILKESKTKDEILKKWPNFLQNLIHPTVLFKNKLLKLRSAPDSNDIIIENIHVSENARIFYKYLVIGTAMVIFG